MNGVPYDELRRRFLVRLLAAGVLTPGAAAFAPLLRAAEPLPPGRSIYRLEGAVKVNGQPATISTVLKPGDRIETGADGLIIFAVGQDAFILRSSSSMVLPAAAAAAEESATASVLRVVTGKLLSVFGSPSHAIETPVATIGIRGTGIYVESEQDETYVCTCYGKAEIRSIDDPSSAESIVSRHHDAARYVTRGPVGQRIRPAPFKNHDDEELLLIESLVGRTPPFPVPVRNPRRRRGY